MRWLPVSVCSAGLIWGKVGVNVALRGASAQQQTEKRQPDERGDHRGIHQSCSMKAKVGRRNACDDNRNAEGRVSLDENHRDQTGPLAGTRKRAKDAESTEERDPNTYSCYAGTDQERDS